MEGLLSRMTLEGGTKKLKKHTSNREAISLREELNLPSWYLPTIHKNRSSSIIDRVPWLHMIPLKIFCPFSSFSMRSFRNCRCLFNARGSEAIFSTSESDKPLTTTGEKISSRPRIIRRSTTWVVTFATNTFSKTLTYDRQLEFR